MHFHRTGADARRYFTADHHVDVGAGKNGAARNAHRRHLGVLGHVRQFRAHVAAGAGGAVLTQQGGVHRHFVYRCAGQFGAVWLAARLHRLGDALHHDGGLAARRGVLGREGDNAVVAGEVLLKGTAQA